MKWALIKNEDKIWKKYKQENTDENYNTYKCKYKSKTAQQAMLTIECNKKKRLKENKECRRNNKNEIKIS